MSLRRKIISILLCLVLCLGFSGAARADAPLLPIAEARGDSFFYGLLRDGQTALPCRHEDIRRIGSVYALCAEGRWALFPVDGTWHTEYVYEEVLPCEGGILCIESAEQNRAVILSRGGEMLLDTREIPVFESLAPYAVYGLAARSEGFAAVYAEDGACLFLDAAGNILPMTFCYTEGFHEGAACVLTDGRWGYLSPDGTWLLPPQYLQAQSFHGGTALVRDAEGFAVIDRTGKILWRPVGDYVWQFPYGSQSFFGVHAHGKDLCFTSEGTLLAHGGVPLQPGKYLCAKLPGGVFALLPDGRELFLPGAEELLWGSGGLFAAKTAEGYSVMDAEGRHILSTGDGAPDLLQDAVNGRTYIFVPNGESFSVFTADGRFLQSGAYLTEPIAGWFALSSGWRQVSV